MGSEIPPDSSRRWRVAFIVAVILCFATGAAAVYGILDQAVTMDGLEVGYKDTRDAAEVLARLGPTVAPRATRSDVLALLRQQHPSALIVATDSTVAIGQLTFRFDRAGTLRKIDLVYAP
jgi:hypothetical protein